MDAVLIDIGTQNEVELPAWPYPDIRSIVLLTPGARSNLGQLRAMGFSAYLVKPVRQSSLVDRTRTKGGTITVTPEMPVHGELVRMPYQATAALPRPGMRALKILFAEDNPVNALLTRELLRRRGHEICEVMSGEAAIDALAAEPFDLLITDIHMPGLDGIEAARRIREDETATGRTRTPIVALTADALETGRQACQDAGMDGFLTKPIEPAELDTMFARLFPNEDGTRVGEAAA